ncbi:hypothetical protein L1987_31136 [Smallanthus sonchifolius]|uniref:Uncharacterized protein n=1 Tax=Smallanthus sonchifolius TaxID=185202 RepID=A0ACB9I450_9ASTR|nr:hypothetical protein L1987_31136 [Smallanthus sonchifolius]
MVSLPTAVLLLSLVFGGSFGEEQKEFDYFALAVQWPPTYCSKSTTCCTQSGCCRGANSPSVFTIHGLWPDYNDGSWPSCCSGPEFNQNQEVLFEAGYVPSNSDQYPAADIISAFENAFHSTPQLVCLSGALEEVRLCLTKDFKFRDCVAASDCPDYVSLPEFSSLDGTKTARRWFSGHESS